MNAHAAAKGYILSQAERDLFQKLVDHMKAYAETPSRDMAEEGVGPGRRVHVARIPRGGLPALSIGANTGTGTGTDETGDDVPGHALCPLYRIDHQAGGPRLVPLNKKVIVYNLMDVRIKAGRWPTVQQDPFGAWLISNPGYDHVACEDA